MASFERAVCCIILALTLAVAGGAQVPADEGRLTPLVESEAELAAFRAIQIEGRLSERQVLIRDFLDSFPSSELRYLVLRTEWLGLMQGRADPEAVIRAATAGLESAREFLGSRLEAAAASGDPGFALADFELRNLEAGYYRSMAGAVGELEDLERTAEYTEAAVEAAERAWRGFQRLAEPGSEEYASQFEVYQTNRLGLFQNAMVVFRDAGRLEEAIAYGGHALGADADNLFTLLTLSSMMARAAPAPEPERRRFLDRAFGYASRALEQLRTGAPVGAEGERVRLEAAAQTTLGLIYYHMGDLDSARAALIQALDGAPEDGEKWYWLGMVYLRQSESEPALASLARAVYLGVADPEVRSSLEGLYEAARGSLDGLEEFIEAEGRQILRGR